MLPVNSNPVFGPSPYLQWRRECVPSKKAFTNPALSPPWFMTQLLVNHLCCVVAVRTTTGLWRRTLRSVDSTGERARQPTPSSLIGFSAPHGLAGIGHCLSKSPAAPLPAHLFLEECLHLSSLRHKVQTPALKNRAFQNHFPSLVKPLTAPRPGHLCIPILGTLLMLVSASHSLPSILLCEQPTPTPPPKPLSHTTSLHPSSIPPRRGQSTVSCGCSTARAPVPQHLHKLVPRGQGCPAHLHIPWPGPARGKEKVLPNVGDWRLTARSWASSLSGSLLTHGEASEEKTRWKDHALIHLLQSNCGAPIRCGEGYFLNDTKLVLAFKKQRFAKKSSIRSYTAKESLIKAGWYNQWSDKFGRKQTPEEARQPRGTQFQVCLLLGVGLQARYLSPPSLGFPICKDDERWRHVPPLPLLPSGFLTAPQTLRDLRLRSLTPSSSQRRTLSSKPESLRSPCKRHLLGEIPDHLLQRASPSAPSHSLCPRPQTHALHSTSQGQK